MTLGRFQSEADTRKLKTYESGHTSHSPEVIVFAYKSTHLSMQSHDLANVHSFVNTLAAKVECCMISSVVEVDDNEFPYLGFSAMDINKSSI